jgi:hypothetical protein
MNFNYSTITNLYNKIVKKIRGGEGENINNQEPAIDENQQSQPITEDALVNDQDNQQLESQSQLPEYTFDESQNGPSQTQTPSNINSSQTQTPSNINSSQTQTPYNIDSSQTQTPYNIDSSQTQTPYNIDSSQTQTPSNIDDLPVIPDQINSEIPVESEESQSNVNSGEANDELNSEASNMQDTNNILTPASQFDSTPASEEESNTQEINEEPPESESAYTSQSTEIPPVIPAFIPNNQTEPYYDSVPYKANQKTYNYLNRDNLKTTFSGLTERNTNPYTIYLCSYTMILNQYLPYFQYWLINIDNTSYKFPSFEFTLPLHPVNPENVDSMNENENQTPDDELFSNAYQTELNKYYGENIPTFKGFIENENIIYVILEEKDNILLDTYKSAFKPAILHETLNLRKICNVVIDESVTNLFKYEYIATIYDETDKVVEYPYLLYLCQGSQGAYINVESVENTEVFIPNKILHGSLGYCYMLTSKMLNEGASNTKRFVVFIENTLYILNKSIASSEYHLFDNADIEEDKEDPDCRNYQYSSVYFWEGNIQLWALYSSKYITAI